jgi:hypothetical protein
MQEAYQSLDDVDKQDEQAAGRILMSLGGEGDKQHNL